MPRPVSIVARMSDPGHVAPWAFSTTSQQWQPPARPKRERQVLAAVLCLAVIAGLLVSAAVVGRPDDGRSASAAMAYVPASGSRLVLAGSDGSVPDQVDEWTTLVGLAALSSGPGAFLYASGDRGLEEIQANTWVRWSSDTGAPGRPVTRTGRLLAALPDGLELRVVSSTSGFAAFSPGILALPADPDQKSWTSTGTVSRGSGGIQLTDVQPYVAELSSRPAGDGCVAVTSRIVVGQEPAAVATDTWCRGRGVTATDEAGQVRAAVERTPSWTGGGPVTMPAPAALGGSWRFERRNLHGVRPLTYRVRPAVLPGGLVVYENQSPGDLVARDWAAAEDADPRWVAHPGGTINSVVAVGPVVIATTTLRRVVAFGADGQYLWQVTLSDVSTVPMVALGSLVVVASLDGSLTAIDVATGTVAWQRSLPNEIRLPPVVDAGGVTVLDQAGNVCGFGADGTLRWQFKVSPPESFTVTGDAVVVASRSDRYVRSHRLPDGTLAWRTPVAGTRTALLPAGERVVVRTFDTLLALSGTSGAADWALDQRVTDAVVHDGQLLVTDRTALRRYDFAGRELGSFPTAESDLSSSPGAMITPTADGLYLFYNAYAYRQERP